ncbi:hypothetical protein COCVIDRAFT_32890 [Bipolaris victoriae FI3]|uniref:Uncharacterized protein n=1 Tax=Bipolaris victoriae (strain FI3) TaxID=930091 RepID=W7ER09_BIPV3|nr:hypothetical protein COCVIDRAFT_32890 [Bipolaris victoriae FI3]
MCKLSSSTINSNTKSENAAVDLEVSTGSTKSSHSVHQRPGLEESRRKASGSSPSANTHPYSSPSFTISELVHALGIAGVSTFGRLRFRTAKRILYELRRRFERQKLEYQAVMSVCRKQGSWRAHESGRISKVVTGKKNFTGKATTHIRKQKGEKPKSKAKKSKEPLIRKLTISTERDPEALSKTSRILAFQTACLAEEAGAILTSIQPRRLRTQTKPRRSLSRARRARRLHFPRHRKFGTKIRYHKSNVGADPTARKPLSKRKPSPKQRKPTIRKRTSRPRVRHVRIPILIKRHASFFTGTIRYPDGARAKFKRSSLSRLRGEAARGRTRGAVLRRVPVEWRATAAAVAVKRREEARRLAATVEGWLGGGDEGKK